MLSKVAGKPKKQPLFDRSPFDLCAPSDVFSAHQLVASLGLCHYGHEGLLQFAMAAVMARRLANQNAHAYLAQIVHDGFSRFGPADHDHKETKSIIRELFN